MKNFGRLDIKDLNHEHISLNGCDVNYIDNNLIIGNDSFSLNSDGNNTLSINSLNNSNSNVLLNSDDNSGENVILFNSYSSKLEDNQLAINSISSNYKHSKFSIGTNKTKIPYTFGYNNEYISKNDETYIFGNNFSGGSENGNFYILSTNSGANFSGVVNTSESRLILENSSNFLIFGNDYLFVYDNIKNTSLDKISNEKFLYSGEDSLMEYKNGYWSHRDDTIQKTLNGYVGNGLLNIESNNISISGQNQNQNKNNSVLIDTNENSDKKSLSNSILINSKNKLSTDLTDSVYIGNGSKDNYSTKGENVLLLNSSFRVGVDGLSAGDVSLSYVEMSKLTSVDDYFGDIINRVYAKTTPYETFSSTYIQDTLDKTNYKNDYKVVNVNSNNFNLFNIESTGNLFISMPELTDIIDIYCVDDNNLFKIKFYRGIIPNKMFVIDSLKDYEIEYKIKQSQYGGKNVSFFIKKAKGKRFIIKLSNYNIKDFFGFSNNVVEIEESHKIEKNTRYSLKLIYKNTLPSKIFFNNIECNYLYNLKNDCVIHKLHFNKLDGIYRLWLDYYKKFGSGNYVLSDDDYLNKFRDFTSKYIADDLTFSLQSKFIKNNSKNLTIEKSPEVITIDNVKYEVMGTNLDYVYPMEDIQLKSLQGAFIGPSTLKDLVFTNNAFFTSTLLQLCQWGCMASFYYHNHCNNKYDNLVEKLKIADIPEDDTPWDLALYIPFAGVDDDMYEKFRPVGDVILKIKLMITLNDGNFYSCLADYHTKHKWKNTETGKEFHPLLNVYRDSYYRMYYGYENVMAYDKPEKVFNGKNPYIETETLTYMTQVFNK